MSSDYVTKSSVASSCLWGGKEPALPRLDMELTERCNNDCVHCCINLPCDDRAARERELSADEIKSILKDAAALGCLSVRFTGGEPLLREDFEEIYVYARKQGIKVMLFTNATLITPVLIDLFKSIPPLENIEVTVYGMTDSSYESISRVPGSHSAAGEGIRLLQESEIPFVVKGVLLPQNMNEVEELEQWAAAIPSMKGQLPDIAMMLDLRGRHDSDEKNSIIKRLRTDAEACVAFLMRNPDYKKSMQKFCRAFLGLPGDKLFTCGAGVGGCVDAYGYLQPCIMLRHPETIYDLRKGSLKDGVTRFFLGLRKKRASNPDYLNRCACCFIKALCEQCPAKSWSEHGTLDTPVEYCCAVAHAQARELGLLDAREKSWEVDNWKERLNRMEV